MDAAEQARREVAEYLQSERDRWERLLADCRIGLFAFCAIAAFVLQYATGVETLIPFLHYSCWLAYAIPARFLVRRLGARRGLMLAFLALDLYSFNSVTVDFRLLRGPQPELLAENAIWFAYSVPVGILLVQLANTFRNDAVLSVAGGVLGVATLYGIAALATGVVRQQDVSAVMITSAAVVALVATRYRQAALWKFAEQRLLLHYVPRAAVERLDRAGPSAMALGGEQRVVTLLSADLRGFTAMSERLPPEKVIEQLNDYHSRMATVIESHHGSLDKFIGDGTLAIFGQLRASDPEDPRHGAAAAIECAAEMLAALEALNADRAAAGLAALAMGIGLHTGPVIAGNIGAAGRRIEFTVIGDAVNTSSRIEGLTKDAGVPVLVSGETARLSGLPLRRIGPMPIRGKAEPIEVFTLGSAVSRAAAR